MGSKMTGSDSTQLGTSREVRPTLLMRRKMVISALGHQLTMAYGEKQYPLGDLSQSAPPFRVIWVVVRKKKRTICEWGLWEQEPFLMEARQSPRFE